MSVDPASGSLLDDGWVVRRPDRPIDEISHRSQVDSPREIIRGPTVRVVVLTMATIDDYPRLFDLSME